MKPCWPEGDLRAYLDGELTPGTQQELSAHLDACGECAAQCRELSARAARVASLMAELGEIAAPAPLPARPRRSWMVAALALAAAMAIAFVMLPKRNGQVRPVAQAPGVVASAAPVAETPAAVRHPVRRRVARTKPAPRADYFLRLDDEPIETGTLVRVGAENGGVQADLILGPDGRAHAIRVIGNQ
jgi:anti-sigma factor RsiW